MPDKLDRSVSLASANVFGFAFIIPVFVAFVPLYNLLWGEEALNAGIDDLFPNLLMTLIVFLGGIVVHELLHGLTWQTLSGQWGVVKYGIKWTALTPYAHLKHPVPAHVYRVGTFMPGFVLGIAPAFMAMITGSGALLWFGIIFTWAAGGDALILWMLRDVPRDAQIEDHPERAGAYVILR